MKRISIIQKRIDEEEKIATCYNVNNKKTITEVFDCKDYKLIKARLDVIFSEED